MRNRFRMEHMSNELFSPDGVKQKLFVSYHHGGDKKYYDVLERTFCNYYDVLQYDSIERAVDSDNSDYVINRMKDELIAGSSCTIVLCGANTPQRKFVDWEIKATLDQQRGLIGVNLPTNQSRTSYTYAIPDRLNDNINTGYAVWVDWDTFTRSAQTVARHVELARSKPGELINNRRALRQKNGG